MDQLPIPDFFDSKNVGNVWRIPYEERAKQAQDWALHHGLPPASTDQTRSWLMLVDVQNTFCIPGFELYVGGRSGRESIKPGSFAKTIKENDIRALFNHDEDYVLGRNKAKTLSLREDDNGLAVDITPPSTQWANDLLVSMKRGDISQMSFGFTVNKAEYDYDKDERTLTDVTLFDVSVVTYPAYPTTSAQVRSLFQKKAASQDVSTPELPIPEEDELERVFRKVRAKEKLTIEEFRLLAAYAPDLSVPPAKHTETEPEPPAKHSAPDTRKGTVADLLIRAARQSTTIRQEVNKK